MRYITLWHGGRNLDSDYQEFKPSRKNRWEYGPGLYLTTHYDRALKYAKGNGRTYQVHVQEGNDIKDVELNIADVNNFIANYVIKSKQKLMLDDIYNNMNRMNSSPFIKANVFLNLIISHEAIVNTKTKNLNQFLVNQTIDYSLLPNYGGRDENIMVVFNNKKIKSVNHFSAKDVILDERILKSEFHINPKINVKNF